MPDYSAEGMNKWKSVLPPDIAGCLGDSGSEGSGALVSALKDIPPEEIVAILSLYAEDITAFGRARRLRLLSWVLNSLPDDGITQMRILADLIGEDEEGNGGRKGEVSGILYQDFLAFTTSLGSRAARSILNVDNMNTVMEAALETREDIQNRLGGII